MAYSAMQCGLQFHTKSYILVTIMVYSAMQCTTVLSYQKDISQSSSLHHVVVHSTQLNHTVGIHGTTLMPNVHLCYSHQALLSS